MKILMIGLGGIGQRHLRNLKTLLGADLEVIAYRTRRQSVVLTDTLQVETGAEVESKYAVRVFTDLGEAIAQKPDAAFVCNPSSLHIPVALECAKANIALFLEKPLSHDETDVQQLIEIVEERQLVALVGYQLRFHPALRLFRDVVQSGRLGRVLSVSAEVGEYLPNWHRYEDYRQMYASRAALGGGVVLSQIHELDYLFWLFGMPQRVFAVGGQLSTLEIDVEDVASSLFEIEIAGQIVPMQLHQDYVQRPPSRGCRVVGDAGRVELDFPKNRVEVFDSNGQSVQCQVFELERNQLFLDQTRHFLDCLRGQSQPLVSIRDGLASLRMALGVKHSLSTRQIVDFL